MTIRASTALPILALTFLACDGPDKDQAQTGQDAVRARPDAQLRLTAAATRFKDRIRASPTADTVPRPSTSDLEDEDEAREDEPRLPGRSIVSAPHPRVEHRVDPVVAAEARRGDVVQPWQQQQYRDAQVAYRRNAAPDHGLALRHIQRPARTRAAAGRSLSRSL